MIDNQVVAYFINVAQGMIAAKQKNDYLTTEEELAIRNILSEAGFEFKSIEFGAHMGQRRDMSDDVENYQINTSCPLKILLESGEVHDRATGWLDCLFRYIENEGPRRSSGFTFARLQPSGPDPALLVQKVQMQISDSRPLPQMPLTPEGDVFLECTPMIKDDGYQYFVRHIRDGDELAYNVGTHKYCGNYFQRHRATATHDSLVCFGCCLRVLIPREVKTYGDLRVALEKNL